METREMLYAVFTDDPINWLKWAVVFAVLIGSYFFSIPLYNKVSYEISWEKKRDIAIQRGHVLTAVLVSAWRSYGENSVTWHAKYEYDFKGKTREYRALFHEPNSPSKKMDLYYLENPKRVFSCEEDHYENHKGFILIPLFFLPWILASLTLILLNITIPEAML